MLQVTKGHYDHLGLQDFRRFDASELRCEKSVSPARSTAGSYARRDDPVDYRFRGRDVFRKVLEKKEEMNCRGSGPR